MATIHNMYRPHSRQKPVDDALAPARGLANGLALSLVLWIVIGVIAAMMFGGWADIR